MTATTKDPLWTRQFLLLLVSAVFMYVSTFMLTPTLPLYVERVGAGDLAASGLIVAAYTLGSLLPRMMWGNLADRWLRQGVYLIGVAIIALVSPLFAVAVLFPLIVGLRFLQGLGFSGASTAGGAMSADLIPASRRAEGVGYYSLANTVGMAIGPGLGLTALQSFGPAWLFGASIASGVIAFGLGLFVRYEQVGQHAQTAVAESEDLGSADPTVAEPAPETPVPGHDAGVVQAGSRWIERTVVAPSLVFLCVVMPYGAVMAFVAAYGLEQGVAQIGLYFSAFAAALFVVRLVVGRLSDTRGVTVVFVPAMASMCAGLVVLYWAESLPVFLASAVLLGLGFGAAAPVLQATAYSFARVERRGAASGTFFIAADLGYGIGAILLGMALSTIDHRIAFAALSVFAVAAAVVFLAVLRPRLAARRLA